MYDRFGLFIDGHWRAATSGETYEVFDPATEEVLGRVPLADEADVRTAIEAAERGQARWRALDPWARSNVLRAIGDALTRRRDEIARIMTLEVGKPIEQSRGEIGLAIDQFYWYAEETKRIYGQTIESRLPSGRMTVTYEPVGIVAAFTAWNFPAALPARKIAPALAAGCSIICRPSEESPGVAMALIDCCREAGVPDGAVNLLTGRASVLGPLLIKAPEIRKVSLTGSTEVGKRMMRDAADTLKRLSMELGGHAPVIVFDDADVESAAKSCVVGKFRNAGQVCVSPSRFFVHDRLVEDFTKQFVDIAKSMKIGNGLDPETEMGPLSTAKRRDAIESIVAETQEAGGRLLCGGRRPPDMNRGFYYEPTVFDEVDDDWRLMCEEPFGPVAPITSFTDFDEVITRANSLPYGLSAYAFTKSLKRAHETREALASGMVGINTFALAAAEAPFGGIRDSGFGREGGSIGIMDYLEAKYSHMVLE